MVELQFTDVSVQTEQISRVFVARSNQDVVKLRLKDVMLSCSKRHMKEFPHPRLPQVRMQGRVKNQSKQKRLFLMHGIIHFKNKNHRNNLWRL